MQFLVRISEVNTLYAVLNSHQLCVSFRMHFCWQLGTLYNLTDNDILERQLSQKHANLYVSHKESCSMFFRGI